MAKLENWRIECQVMWGTVYGYDSLPDGMGIHTSGIKSLEVCNGYAEAVTRSGTRYYLGFDSIDMNQNALETTKAELSAFGVSADFIGEAKILTRARKKAELMSVRQTVENGDLYLVATSEGVVRAYYKCKDRAYRLNIGIHVGMFQDSVLIRGRDVDFRYFPYQDCMKTYNGYENIRRVLVNNAGRKDTMLDDFVCRAGEVTVIEIKENI